MTSERPGDRHDTAPRRRWWLAIVPLVIVGLGVAVYFILRPNSEPPVLAEVVQVQSAVAQEGDSLHVVVQWQLSSPPDAERAESLRVEVRVDSMSTTAAQVHIRSGLQRQDTVYIPAPARGAVAEGLSCVAAQYHSMISRESCTPWRYVRPLASPPSVAQSADKDKRTRKQGAVAAEQPRRIVVQPSGLQVDPDIGGRCATWQHRHPTESVWIEVNRTAIPECTGPNHRPTVAQFCAFAELGNGRRVKTTNSANNPYCDELFRAWEHERVS